MDKGTFVFNFKLSIIKYYNPIYLHKFNHKGNYFNYSSLPPIWVNRCPKDSYGETVIIIGFRFINPRLKSWVNEKKVKVSNRFNGL